MADNFAFRRPQGRPKTTDPKKLNRIKDLLDSGHTYDQIAESTNLSRGSVASHVKRNGWQSGTSHNPAGRRGNPDKQSRTAVSEPYKPKLKDDFKETPEDVNYRKKLGFGD